MKQEHIAAPIVRKRSLSERIQVLLQFYKYNWRLMVKRSAPWLIPLSLLAAYSYSRLFSTGVYASFVSDTAALSSLTPQMGLMLSLTIICSVLISLCMLSMVAAILLRGERLGVYGNVSWSEMRKDFFLSMKKTILSFLVILVLLGGIGVVCTLISKKLVIPYILLVLSLCVPINVFFGKYLFGHGTLGSSLSYGLKQGFRTWGGGFLFILITSVLFGIASSVISLPMMVISSALKAMVVSGGIPTSEISFGLQAMFVLLTALTFYCWTFIGSSACQVLLAAYQYGHAEATAGHLHISDEEGEFSDPF